MYDFTDDGKPVKDWTTSSREEAFAPGHFNQRRYVPEQPAVPQDRTRSKDDLWRAHSTGPSPHWNVVLSAAAFHKARAVAGTQSTAEDAALYRGIQAYMHHSMPPDAAPSVAPEPVAWEGGEEWESLAWELCADENGEDACNELIWEGGPIPEPWGDRWMKYEGEAKRLIALVHKHAAHPPRAPLTEEQKRDLVKECDLDWQRGFMLLFDDDPTNRYAVLIEAVEAAHGIGGK